MQFSSINQVRKGNGDWSDWYPWQAGCIVLPQWEPLSNLDEWLTLGGIIITSEEEPEGDLCSDLGKFPTRIGHRFGNVGWRWSLVRWLALQHCGGDGWSYWDGYYFRRCRWKHLSAVAICGSFQWQNRITFGTLLKLVETLIVMQVLLRQSLWGQLSLIIVWNILKYDFCKSLTLQFQIFSASVFFFAGLDSLSLISLARRLSSKVNKVRSVELRRFGVMCCIERSSPWQIFQIIQLLVPELNWQNAEKLNMKHRDVEHAGLSG